MNLQENIRKVLIEDRKLSNFLRRRLDMLDYEVEKNLGTPFAGSNICIFFKSDIEYFETIMENSIDAMYYNYFSHIDDNSGEWAHTYLDMVNYIRNKYQDKIMEYYDDNCGSGLIPLKESIRRVLREENSLLPMIRRRIPHDDLEREFIESLDKSSGILVSIRQNGGFIRTKEIFEHITISMMMDGIHHELHSTTPENSDWYDDVFNNLRDYYRHRINVRYNNLLLDL
jgi:hypothetical protein